MANGTSENSTPLSLRKRSYSIGILRRTVWIFKNWRRSLIIFLPLLAFFSFCIFLIHNYSLEKFTEDARLGDYISSTVLVFTAIIAIWLTWMELNQYRSEAKKDREASEETTKVTARRNETLSLIKKTEFDEEFIDAKVTFQAYAHKTNGEMEELFAGIHYRLQNNITIDKELHEDMIDIRLFFNSFELVALGIKQGVLDEDFYKLWQATGFIDVWNRSAKTIGVMRKCSENPKIYRQWEELVKKWGALEEYNKHVKKAECSQKEYEKYCHLEYTPKNKNEGGPIKDEGSK